MKNDKIIKELGIVLKDLKDAKSNVWEDTCAYGGINRATARIETMMSLLED